MNTHFVALFRLVNVGEKTLHDLKLLDIATVQELATSEPDVLYTRLEQITGKHQDPCVWDVFAAIIHEARTGEGSPWWFWTPIRKGIFKNKSLCLHHKK